MSDDDRSCPHCQAPRNAAPADGAREGPCPRCGRSEDETGIASEAAVAAPPGRGGRRGSQNLAVLGVALVVLLGAGGSIAWSLSQEDWFRPKEWFRTRGEASAAAAAPRAAVIAPNVPRPEDASERCELRIFRGATGGEPVVVVTEPGN